MFINDIKTSSRDSDQYTVTERHTKGHTRVDLLSNFPALLICTINYEGRTESHEQLFFCMRTENSR